MDVDTPREMIRRILRSSNVERTENEASLVEGPQVNVDSTKKRYSSSKRRVEFPISSPATKRKRQSISMTDDTPRTTIKQLLGTAVNETPVVKILPKKTPSAISKTQYERLVGSSQRQSKQLPGSSRRRRSAGRKQSFSTPSEHVTPRENIKTFLRAAEIETPVEAFGTRDSSENENDVDENENDIDENENDIDENENDNDENENDIDENENDIDENENDIDENENDVDENENDIDENENDVDENENDVDENEPDVPTLQTLHEFSERDDSEPEVPDIDPDVTSYNCIDDVSNHGTILGTSNVIVSDKTPVLSDINISKASPVVPGQPAQTASKQRKPNRNTKPVKRANKQKSNVDTTRLPNALVQGIFEHFSTCKLSKDALEVIQQGSEEFFKNISHDLMTYCKHAKRKQIEQADIELLMERQGLISSKQSLRVLIEKLLPREYRQELIPCASAYNKVYPKEKSRVSR